MRTKGLPAHWPSATSDDGINYRFNYYIAFRVFQDRVDRKRIDDEFLGKLLPILIVAIGAQGVFDQTLSVGALIAFRCFPDVDGTTDADRKLTHQ